MKIACVVGARPQFIKVGLLFKELKRTHDTFIIHTDQHYDYQLSKSFFDQLNIEEPKYHLGVGSGRHGYQTAEMLRKIEEILVDEDVELLVVFGDTNSTLAGALAAAKLHIKIAHVEAGLRNFDKKKPEEINRILTDHVSNVLFAPTLNAVKNLKKEGIEDNIHVVGDVSNDVLQYNTPIAEEKSNFLADYNLSSKAYYLVTVHKSKNTDSKRNLTAIIDGLIEIDYPIVFPIHPRTVKVLEEYGLSEKVKNSKIEIIEPLTYFDMLMAIKNAKKMITDSGGIQKEAYAYQVPCITMRKTEWVETVEDGWNKEVDIHDKLDFIDTINNFNGRKGQNNFLGNGDTYLKIAKILGE